MAGEEGEPRRKIQPLRKLPVPHFQVHSQVDSAYLTLQNRPITRTHEVTPGVIVYYDKKGEAVGVGLLNMTPGTRFHPRSPDASPETLRELAGSIRLEGPVPSHKFLEDWEDVKRGADLHNGIPLTPTEDEKKLLSKTVGTSSQHDEYYVRAPGQPGGSEIWWLANYTLGKPKDEAVQALKEDYDMTDQEAEVAWLFVNTFPRRSNALQYKHTGTWTKHPLVGEEQGPEDILDLKP